MVGKNEYKMTIKTIRKSIRLSPEESREVARLSEQRSLSEAALKKKWIQEGIRAEKLELAIQAYMQRKTDLRGGASMADVSYNRFIDEVQKRNIIILDDDHFLDSLAFLADAFRDETLRRAVQKVRTEANLWHSAPGWPASFAYTKNWLKYFFVNNNILRRKGSLPQSGPCGSNDK